MAGDGVTLMCLGCGGLQVGFEGGRCDFCGWDDTVRTGVASALWGDDEGAAAGGRG